MFNGAILVVSTILKAVMSSATEAESGGLLYNCKEATVLRQTLLEMGHPQPPTLIQTDNNACAAGIANDTVKQCRSKAMDMRFYWDRDCVAKGDFIIHWHRGSDNLADYFTKHYSPAHHRLMRSRYLVDLHRPDFANATTQLMRRCVDDFPTLTASTTSAHHPGYEASSLVSSTSSNSSDTIYSNPVLPYLLPDYYNPYNSYPQLTSSVTELIF